MILREMAEQYAGIAFTGVVPEQDADGNWKNVLTVTMRSGAVLRIIVAEV